jgi:hypothetical protein
VDAAPRDSKAGPGCRFAPITAAVRPLQRRVAPHKLHLPCPNSDGFFSCRAVWKTKTEKRTRCERLFASTNVPSVFFVFPNGTTMPIALGIEQARQILDDDDDSDDDDDACGPVRARFSAKSGHGTQSLLRTAAPIASGRPGRLRPPSPSRARARPTPRQVWPRGHAVLRTARWRAVPRRVPIVKSLICLNHIRLKLLDAEWQPFPSRRRAA